MKLLKENYWFWIVFILYLFFGAFWLINHQKGEMVLLLNGGNTAFWDTFFKYVTFLGDGIFYGVVILIFLFWRYTHALMFGIGLLTTTIFAQGLKNTLFAGSPRPRAFFNDDSLLHFVEGVTVHAYNSFPSGHSTSAFSVFCLLALWAKNPIWGFLLVFLGVLATLSRIYLAQHFFVDTYTGAVFGTISSIIIYQIFSTSPRFQKTAWRKGLLNKSIT